MTLQTCQPFMAAQGTPSEIAHRTCTFLFTLFAHAAILLLPPYASGMNTLLATDLACEYLKEPLGIDNPNPRLSWVATSDRRGERQTGYRILVASSIAALERDEGDLWDSGEVQGGQTTLIAYAGRRLRSHQECHWKVRVRNRDGNPSPWSTPSRWTTGILTPGEWNAEWIGFDEPRKHEQGVPFSTARWIWYPGDTEWNAPPGRRYFVRALFLPADKRVSRADLAVTADDSFTLFVNGTEALSSPGGAEAWKTPRRREVSSLFAPGRTVLYIEADHRAQGPAGLLIWLRISFDDGTTETIVSDRGWTSAAGHLAHWKTGGPLESEGKESVPLANIGTAPWRLLDGSFLVLPPPRYLWADLTLRKPVRRALLYATALGLCDMIVNGQRVSDDLFTPGWTDYTRRVYYRTYDITGLLHHGTNRVGGILADGWFSGYLGWALMRDHYGRATRLKAQVHIEYDDGTSEEFGTGRGWNASTGPILEADFLMGETLDARLYDPLEAADPAGASRESVEGSPVDVGTDMTPLLQAHPAPPVRACGEFPPVSTREVLPGTYVFDLERTFAGFVRLRVREPRGTKITLRFAERLNPDGTLYTDNLRGARAIDTYICMGTGEEVWEPRFTFHGFRYVEVTGLTGPPGPRAVTGIAVSTAVTPASEFTSSSDMLNRLYANILWTQRANFIDIPTDCPQRDERLGWTGDAQVYCRSACLNADVQSFFHKWLTDLSDAQRTDGQFPMVAPLKGAGDDGGPAWADAGVFVPWTIYEMYGDTTVLARHYEGMKRFVEFNRRRSTPDLLPPAEFHCFGDWLNIDAETPTTLLFTAFFARSTELLWRTAAVLGRTDDATQFRELHTSIVTAFRREFVHNDGSVTSGTQTAYALALGFGLLDEDTVPLAARHLIADLEQRGWHLSTGFVGTKELMTALSGLDRHDIAYRLLLNETFPSWGFTIRNGATSIWERWDGWTPEKGFQSPTMNSFQHYAFGAVYEWMVESIGGIRSDGPGFSNIIIAPSPGRDLESARVSYNSVRGRITSEWKKSGQRFTLNVEIPANTKAIVFLPAVEGSARESGAVCESREDVRFTGDSRSGARMYAVGGGTYRFECDYKE